MEVIKIKISQIAKNHNKYIDNKTNIYYDIFTRDNIVKFTYYDYLYIERQKTIHCSEIREEKDRTNLISIIEIILKEKIGQEKANQLIKKEMKGEDENMLACVEMIREENKRIRREGIKEGIREGRKTIISNMIEKGMSLKEIQEITKATKKEIEKIEKTERKDMLECVKTIRKEEKPEEKNCRNEEE